MSRPLRRWLSSHLFFLFSLYRTDGLWWEIWGGERKRERKISVAVGFLLPFCKLIAPCSWHLEMRAATWVTQPYNIRPSPPFSLARSLTPPTRERGLFWPFHDLCLGKEWLEGKGIYLKRIGKKENREERQGSIGYSASRRIARSLLMLLLLWWHTAAGNFRWTHQQAVRR